MGRSILFRWGWVVEGWPLFLTIGIREVYVDWIMGVW